MLSLLLCIAGCAPSIAPFSSRAYEQAVDLKIDTLRLIERAEEPYGKHSSRIEALQIRLLKAREYARGRPHNDITTRQWEIMVDSEGFMAGGFLSRWASEDSSVLGIHPRGISSDRIRVRYHHPTREWKNPKQVTADP